MLIEVFCSNCGAEAEPGSRFCEHCGAPLQSAERPGEVAEQPPPQYPTGWSVPAGAATPPNQPSARPGHPSAQEAPAENPWEMPQYPAPSGPPPPWSGARAQAGEPLAPFGAPLARWWQRVGAMVLDILVVGVPLLIVNVIINRAFGHQHYVTVNGTLHSVKSLSGGAAVAVDALLSTATGLYFAILNGTGRGQTVGDRSPGIAVRDVDTGAPIGFWRGVLRWFVRSILYVAFVIPGLINDLLPLWDSRRQTLADKAARSVMIRVK